MLAKSILITGANRGLGLEFTSQYAAEGWQVIAATRQPDCPALKKLAEQFSNIKVIKLDLNDLHGCETTLSQINQPLDILINNAGISGEDNQNILDHVDFENLEQVFKVNTIAPITITQALMSALRKGQDKVIVNITSRMGSIADNDSGQSYAYRASKSALNSIMRSLQIDLRPEGFKVLLLHPGWVSTDMGGPNAFMDPLESVSNMRKLIAKAHELPEQFYHCDGSVLPW